MIVLSLPFCSVIDWKRTSIVCLRRRRRKEWEEIYEEENHMNRRTLEEEEEEMWVGVEGKKIYYCNSV